MDNQNMNLEPKAGFFSKSYLKHIVGLLGLIALVGGSFFVWDGYFSESAKYGQQVEENMNKYTEWEKNYNKAMTEDVYGGKTPQETLNMFIDALKKEDIDLASKYFMLNSVGQVDQKWVDGLRKSKEDGKLQEIVKLIAQAKQTFKDDDGAVFKLYDSIGEIVVMVEIKLNELSKVWKIESL
ncbi:MAG: hypothetical protein Q7S46_03095 [Gallionella sp.]|nr:hypothetical protein [Gallionella sp.]